jgi:hypothetical protein
LRKRQEGVAEEIKEIPWKAQHRLHKRYCRLAATRKEQRKIITALGRELLGFIWAIGIKTETAARRRIVLLCYKLSTLISISLALALVMPYVEVDEPPPDVFVAPA